LKSTQRSRVDKNTKIRSSKVAGFRHIFHTLAYNPTSAIPSLDDLLASCHHCHPIIPNHSQNASHPFISPSPNSFPIKFSIKTSNQLLVFHQATSTFSIFSCSISNVFLITMKFSLSEERSKASHLQTCIAFEISAFQFVCSKNHFKGDFADGVQFGKRIACFAQNQTFSLDEKINFRGKRRRQQNCVV
jgi:hypothetical protein